MIVFTVAGGLIVVVGCSSSRVSWVKSSGNLSVSEGDVDEASERELCALFCSVKEQAMRVFPHIASRKPIILAVPTDTIPSVVEPVVDILVRLILACVETRREDC